ncbi:hypothetical protein M0Q50_03700 [bacterium]|jgi:5'(3')-deoxyribonucleotidase|nr:hypothetical protein [bacterium]
MKKLFFDMDGVIVNFQSGIDKLDIDTLKKYKDCLDEVPGIFGLMEPIDGAIDAVYELSKHFDVYILSTAPWNNVSSLSDKIKFIHNYFGKDKDSVFYKKVFLTHHKEMVDGDILIDDRSNNGAKDFKGEWIHFGSEKYPNWKIVIEYIIKNK